MKVLAVVLMSLVAGCYGQVTVDTSLFVNQTILLGTTGNWTCTVTGTQINQALVFRKEFPADTWNDLSSDAFVLNATKYSVTGKYSFVMNDMVLSDDGGYRCAIDSLGVVATAYLTVGDAPSSSNLYWGDFSNTTVQDVAANLTCATTTSRPPATFRWFKGATQVTTGVITPTTTVDANGYGVASSILQVTPTATDLGENYTCIVDLADLQNVDTKILTVAWSGAGNILASVSLVFAAVFASLRM